MNKKKSILESSVFYTLTAILAGFLIGAVFLVIAGISPAVAYGKLLSSVFDGPGDREPKADIGPARPFRKNIKYRRWVSLRYFLYAEGVLPPSFS